MASKDPNELGALLKQRSEWLRGTGPLSDIVMSSRLRLARNIEKIPFATKATEASQEEVLRIVNDGLAPADLLEPSKSPRSRPLLERLIARTLEHYDAAWGYTLAIPRREWRMRLACAWSLLIGLATLAAIAKAPDPLAHAGPIKIPRRAVRAILARSTAAVWSNRALGREATRLRRRVMVGEAIAR